MRQDGFTLVEVLVALVILAVGLVGLAGAAAVTVRAVADGTLRTRGVALASARREMMVGGAGCAAGVSRRVPFTVRWGAAGGVAVVTVTRPASRGPRADSVVGLCGG